MAICRVFQGLCSLFLVYIDIFIAYFLLCFATLTFFVKMIISPFNALLVRLDSFLLNVSMRKISNIRREVFRLLQFDGDLMELGTNGTNSRRDVAEGESFQGPTISRRESTLSINSCAITGYTENTEVTERIDTNLEGDNTSIVARNLQSALKAEKSAHIALRQELHKERRAAATAAEEAMAMILRLQEEKAAIEMEARQFRAVAEGKVKHEEEEIEMLKEILLKREREKHVLEKEVEAYQQIYCSDTASYNDRKDGDEMNDMKFSKKYSSSESSKNGEDGKLENGVCNNAHDVHIINGGSKKK